MARSLGLGGITDAFSSRNFRIFWTGNFVHNITVWVNRMALGWLTWELTHSGTWLGLIGAAGMLPMVFVGPLAGVTADRFGHRLQLVTATYIGAITAFVTAMMVAFDAISPFSLLALTLLSGLTRAFNIPARSAMVHALVERRHLSSAIGVNSATYYGGNFIGPALAGLIISVWGIKPAFFAYVIGELIAATSFVLLRFENAPAGPKRKFDLFGDLIAGARYTFRNRGILSLMMLSAVMALFLQPYMDMLPGMADKVFGMGAEGLAFLTSATGAGAMCGGLWIAQRGRIGGLVRIHVIMLAGAIVMMLAFVATDILVAAMAALFAVGFCLISAHSSNMTLVQNAVDGDFRARVISFSGVVGVSGPALGALIIGWAATQLGFRLPIGVSAVVALAAFALIARMVLARAPELEASKL
ncbi:MAG: MFS transporter [Rhodospirillaceae bacterium]|nr:MFS transporter [Rhodospirillaceae bacterium]MBT4671727.1 MFS transporter [Rhodospirillaceae bacterium]MBT4751551.1 MFS transporter [Rhodospirillaceae bacterium]MBT5177388.1 MFS transporter [Rhodospirillaceae bacterium]MBT6289095.1 MFS transporter [Rhodospirillaceae bacterium]